MIYQILNLIVVGALMLAAFGVGLYIGRLKSESKIFVLLEDSARGDRARDELGLFLEWATDPVAEAELIRLCGPWRSHV